MDNGIIKSMISSFAASIALITLFLLGPTAFALYATVFTGLPREMALSIMIGGMLSAAGIIILSIIPGFNLSFNDEEEEKKQ